MTSEYYTYRITLANPDNVQVKKSDSEHNPLGEPSGKFASENLERIRELHKAAQNGDLRGPDVEKLGELLFDTLFDEGLRSDFFSFHENARQKDVPLRLELEVDERQLPDVVALP